MRRADHTAVLAVLLAGALATSCSPAAGTAGEPADAAAAKAAPAAAPPSEATTSARAFVETVYARYTADENFNPIVTRDGIWDPDMLARMVRVDKSQEASGDAIFDFEPLCQCQDNGGMIARAGEARSTGPDTASVPVQLSYPGGESSQPELKLVRVGGQWRVHDIATKDMPSYAAHLEAALAEP